MEPLGATAPAEAPAEARHEAPPQPPARRASTPSVRPALLVVGIAAALVTLFGIAAALTGSGSPPAPAGRPAPAARSGLAPRPAAAALAPIVQLSTPPADVLHALVLPAGSTAVSTSRWNGATQYAAKMRFGVAASQASVLAFYKAELEALGWSISSTGAAARQRGTSEVLAQRASRDGWYWEVGVVVSPTTFSAGTDTTRFTLDLFEVPDAQ